MADAITSDLDDMMGDTITCTPGSEGLTGDWTPSGAVINPSCHISGKTRVVVNDAGEEVVSSFKVIVNGVYGLTVEGHRYTLPPRYSPRTNLKAISVMPVAHEGGAHHEVIMLP